MRSDQDLAKIFISYYGRDRRLTGTQTMATSFAIGTNPIASLLSSVGLINRSDPTKIFTSEEDAKLAKAYETEGLMLQLEQLIIQWGDFNSPVGAISPRAQFLIRQLEQLIPALQVIELRQFFSTKLSAAKNKASSLDARDKERGKKLFGRDVVLQQEKVKEENEKCCGILDWTNDPTKCFKKCIWGTIPLWIKISGGALLLMPILFYVSPVVRVGSLLVSKAVGKKKAKKRF